MNTIEDNTCDKALCNSDDNGQGLDEAATGTSSKILCSRCYEQGRGEVKNIFGRSHLSKTGRSPNKNTAQGNALGMDV